MKSFEANYHFYPIALFEFNDSSYHAQYVNGFIVVYFLFLRPEQQS